ncbi:hypothetical protein SKAU_G00050770 [Synaphobranchus kaupii]|uniref:Uncharacterized protein n=1 Tax=Synaphobranchus kaupii TaxID=118154 RepID=A0A9Q1G2Z9_SYNKA|nr:hypothetical protein SKAU_G00050770 [Synaphobranchus kaupii]
MYSDLDSRNRWGDHNLEQSPSNQTSLAMMQEPQEVVEETVTIEEDPGTPTSHVSVVTSDDGTTRRTETKVTKMVKTVTTRTVRQATSTLGRNFNSSYADSYGDTPEGQYRHYGVHDGYADMTDNYGSLSRGVGYRPRYPYTPVNSYRPENSYTLPAIRRTTTATWRSPSLGPEEEEPVRPGAGLLHRQPPSPGRGLTVVGLCVSQSGTSPESATHRLGVIRPPDRRSGLS